jgi:hypothetical protein
MLKSKTKVIQLLNLVFLLMWQQVNLEALSNWEEKQMFKACVTLLF